jgi:hypothetical protein
LIVNGSPPFAGPPLSEGAQPVKANAVNARTANVRCLQ